MFDKIFLCQVSWLLVSELVWMRGITLTLVTVCITSPEVLQSYCSCQHQSGTVEVNHHLVSNSFDIHKIFLFSDRSVKMIPSFSVDSSTVNASSENVTMLKSALKKPSVSFKHVNMVESDDSEDAAEEEVNKGEQEKSVSRGQDDFDSQDNTKL